MDHKWKSTRNCTSSTSRDALIEIRDHVFIPELLRPLHNIFGLWSTAPGMWSEKTDGMVGYLSFSVSLADTA